MSLILRAIDGARRMNLRTSKKSASTLNKGKIVIFCKTAQLAALVVRSRAMSAILQELELENETYITTIRIQELAEKHSIGSSPSLIAHRLKESGWLLATPQKGVWEFAPALPNSLRILRIHRNRYFAGMILLQGITRPS